MIKGTLKITISLMMFILAVGGFAMDNHIVGAMFIALGTIMIPPFYNAIKHIVKKRSIIVFFMIITFITALIITPSSESLPRKEETPLNDITVNANKLDSELKLSFIDVGQGDCVLLACNGHYALYDTGYYDYRDKVIEYLKSQGIENLDYLIISHNDSDHIGSAATICDNFKINNLIIDTNIANINNITPFELLMKAKDNYDINLIEPVKDTIYPLGDSTIKLLSPIREYDEINNNSICILITHYDDTILLTGDAESEAEADLINAYGKDIDVDILKAGHHGSSSSNTESFLDITTPQAIIISCELNNDYGHPTQRVINDIRERKINCFRTDEQGTIECISSGGGFSFNVEPSTTWTIGTYKE